MNYIDLRSDTLTTPHEEMRKAMANAEVGDDGRTDDFGRGSDPTINALEDYAAELMGKEAALFCASGSMGNIVSLVTQCSRSDKVAVDKDLHLVRTEKAPFMSEFFGLNKIEYNCTQMGIPDISSIETLCDSDIKLLCIENSHNFGGGICPSLDLFRKIRTITKQKGIPVHLDGARIFNAALHLNISPRDIADCSDTMMFCLSKGIGAPFGSLLCGSKSFIKKAREIRKLLGGGLRQGGIMAAAGLYALKHDLERIHEDNENAKQLGEYLKDYTICKLIPVETNIVMLDISKTGKTSSWFEESLKQCGLLAKGMGSEYLRMTTYRGISAQDIQKAGEILQKFMEDNNFC